MTNNDVKQAFMQCKVAGNDNLVSTGDRLLSYGWWEVARWVKGKIVVRNGIAYSQTTASKHMNGIYGERAKTETPKDKAKMNL